MKIGTYALHLYLLSLRMYITGLLKEETLRQKPGFLLAVTIVTL